jgi:receptor expression-enhancing protein 5/6
MRIPRALLVPDILTLFQWLTYWVVYAFLTVFESAVNAVYWFPFYYTFKFVLILWMALPQTS